MVYKMSKYKTKGQIRKLGKRRLPTAENESYLEILHLILDEPLNSNILSKRLAKTQSCIFRQLEDLCRRGYIKKKDNPKNSYIVSDKGKECLILANELNIAIGRVLELKAKSHNLDFV